MWKIIFWTEFVFLLSSIFSVSCVFAYTNNYGGGVAGGGVRDSDSMESYMENSNSFYGRKYAYDYVDPAKENQQLSSSSSSDPTPSVKEPVDRKINSVDVDDEELMETGDDAPLNEVDFQDSSEDVEVMIVGENETPKEELLKRAKRYLGQINLGAYTPASPFYNYYNPNFGSNGAGISSGESGSNSDRDQATASSLNSRTMESLLASCQLTNLLLYRAVNQKTTNQLIDPIGQGASDYVRSVPLAIGTFGAILEGNLGPRWPTPPYSPVSTRQQSQPLQTYITTRNFLTTVTSTEVLRQGPTLSTHLRIYAFKTSKVQTLYFTKDVTPTPVVDNPKPTSTATVTTSSPILPRARVDDNISRIIGENRQNRTTVDTNRQKRKNPPVIEEVLESSEEQFDKDDEYAAYQYGTYRCPPIETETTTSTKTITVVNTVTKYINPSPSYISSSSLRTSRTDFSKRAQKTFEPTRRVPFRPVGRLYSYTRASYN